MLYGFTQLNLSLSLSLSLLNSSAGMGEGNGEAELSYHGGTLLSSEGTVGEKDEQSSDGGGAPETWRPSKLDAGALFVLKSEGHSSSAPRRDYSLPSDRQDLTFGVFNAIAIIATCFGNGIIPEIQATAAPPVKGKMFKGLCLCYAVVAVTFFSVAVSGYWAFGNLADGTILSNFVSDDGRLLVPKWFLFTTNIFTILQLSAVAIVYLQPTNEVLERIFGDPEKGQYSARNVVPRIIFRSLSVAAASFIAAMLPFFGDINALIGAFGFLPLDFVVPAVLYNKAFRPSSRGAIFWANAAIAAVFSAAALLASAASVRQIVLDANNYKLFANI